MIPVSENWIPLSGQIIILVLLLLHFQHHEENILDTHVYRIFTRQKQSENPVENAENIIRDIHTGINKLKNLLSQFVSR